MPTLILLHRQIYQAPESVVMKHRVHYRPTILFLTHQSNVIDCSLLLARNHISKNVKPCSYVHKKLAQNWLATYQKFQKSSSLLFTFRLVPVLFFIFLFFIYLFIFYFETQQFVGIAKKLVSHVYCSCSTFNHYSSTISYLQEVTCNNPQHEQSPTLNNSESKNQY